MQGCGNSNYKKNCWGQTCPVEPKSSTTWYLMMHLFMAHESTTCAKWLVNTWLHMGTGVRSSHLRRRAYENPAPTTECSPITNIRIHLYIYTEDPFPSFINLELFVRKNQPSTMLLPSFNQTLEYDKPCKL
jgi:hypothetical protein